MIIENTKALALELLGKAELKMTVGFDRYVIVLAKLEDGRILMGEYISDEPLDMEVAREACIVDIFEKLCAELSEPAYPEFSMSKDQAQDIIAFADAGMNYTEAAKKQSCSRSALSIRLKKIKEQTGKDPRNFYDFCQLVLEARTVLQEA